MLTHSDITAELFLAIGYDYNYEVVDRKMYDEVLAEWKKDEHGRLNLVGRAYVDGGEFGETISGIRFNVIFPTAPQILPLSIRSPVISMKKL